MNSIKISFALFKNLIKDKATIYAILSIVICFSMYIIDIDASPDPTREFYKFVLMKVTGPSLLKMVILPIMGIYGIIIYKKVNKSKEIIARIKSRFRYTTIQILTNILLVTFVFIVSILIAMFIMLCLCNFNVSPPEIVELPFVDLINSSHLYKVNVNLFILTALFKWYIALISIQLLVYVFCTLFKSKLYAILALSGILFFIENSSNFTTGNKITDKLLIHFYLDFDPGFQFKNLDDLLLGSIIYFGVIFIVSVILIYIINRYKDIENDARY